MSIGICGKIKLHNNQDIVDVSYEIQKIAIENKIWCKLGGNVSNKIFEIYGKRTGKYLYFEITDSPIDNFADELLMPNVVRNNDYSIEMRNKTCTNLDKIKQFIFTVMEIQKIQKVYLDINYLFREKENYSKININQFTEYIYDKYEKENFFMPPINLIVQR